VIEDERLAAIRRVPTVEDPRHRPPVDTETARLKVLDLGTQLAGPFAATLLGDLGAEVIKVELPDGGDPLRGPDGLSPRWQIESRNKRCVTLNLRVPEGQELLRRLAGWADVLVENFRPGVMARWNLAYGDLRQANPRLVYVSVSGFGQDGPRSGLPGYDHIGSAFGGLTHLSGPRDRPPAPPGVPVVDYSTGMLAAMGALESVRRRDAAGPGGRGEWVQTALYETMVRIVGTDLAQWSLTGAVRERVGGQPAGEQESASAHAYTFGTRDGRWVVAYPISDKQFGSLADLVGDPVLRQSRFATRPGRIANAGDLDAVLRRWVAGQDAAPLLAALAAADVPASLVNSVADIAVDPHVQAQDAVVAVTNSRGQEMLVPAVTPRLVERPGGIRWTGEPLGASNDAVYRGLLGVDPDQLGDLRRRGVI
jgi:crotonobetainyl-CoA:carnitine CoA-transferase CaiB-like acyl-CoA transferase